MPKLRGLKQWWPLLPVSLLTDCAAWGLFRAVARWWVGWNVQAFTHLSGTLVARKLELFSGWLELFTWQMDPKSTHSAKGSKWKLSVLFQAKSRTSQAASPLHSLGQPTSRGGGRNKHICGHPDSVTPSSQVYSKKDILMQTNYGCRARPSICTCCTPYHFGLSEASWKSEFTEWVSMLRDLFCGRKDLSKTPKCQKPHRICTLDMKCVQKMNRKQTTAASSSLPNVSQVKMETTDTQGNLGALARILDCTVFVGSLQRQRFWKGSKKCLLIIYERNHERKGPFIILKGGIRYSFLFSL